MTQGEKMIWAAVFAAHRATNRAAVSVSVLAAAIAVRNLQVLPKSCFDGDAEGFEMLRAMLSDEEPFVPSYGGCACDDLGSDRCPVHGREPES